MASGSESITERMARQHAAELASMQPTVEDVPDENDAPTPLTATTNSQQNNNTPAPAPPFARSEVSKGKQTVPPSDAADDHKPKRTTLDTQDEELFPALGSSRAADRSANSTWSARPAGIMTGGQMNGHARNSSAASAASMAGRSSIPSRSNGIPAHAVNIPGNSKSESFDIEPADLKPLSTSLDLTLKKISQKSKAQVKVVESGYGRRRITVTGSDKTVIRSVMQSTMDEICKRKATALTVPGTAERKIRGPQNQNLKTLETASNARITFRKGQTENNCIIEGNPFAMQMAVNQIEPLVRASQPTTKEISLDGIPPELFPFLQHTVTANPQAIERGNEVKVNIPRYYQRAQALNGAGQNGMAYTSNHPVPIRLSGPFAPVDAYKAYLEAESQALRASLQQRTVDVAPGRHRLVTGREGENIAQILADTGCSVLIPHDADEEDGLIIIGPADRVQQASNQILDQALELRSEQIDIARLHNDRQHAQNVAKYLRERELLKHLEEHHGVQIVAANDDLPLEIFSGDAKQINRTAADLKDVIRAYPASRFGQVKIDPFYHQHVRQNFQPRLKSDRGVHLIMPQDPAQDEIVLVYEGIPDISGVQQIPRQKPSAQETAAFEQALAQAQQELLAIIEGIAPVGSREIDVPHKYRSKVRQYVANDAATHHPRGMPMQFAYGADSADTSARPNIRGPQDHLDALSGLIQAFIEQEKQDELERNHVTEFDYPEKHFKHLIGQGGSNINAIREKFDVDVKTKDGGGLEIKGPQAKAARAKAHILEQLKVLEDEKTIILSIPSQYHRNLIGEKGSNATRLEQRYGVRVQFPKPDTIRDDASTVNGSEKGGRKGTTQTADQVIVRGPKKGADEAAQEILDLHKHVAETSYTAEVQVAKGFLPSLIGKGGREIEELRTSTGAAIDIPKQVDGETNATRVTIKLRGVKAGVEAAKSFIQERAKKYDQIETRTINIDPKHHSTIIGSGGSNIAEIVRAAGGPSDRTSVGQMVKIPRAGTNESTITLEGPPQVLNAIEKSLQEFANSVTEIVEIPPERHGKLIGPGGRARTEVQQKFNVNVDFPRTSVTGPARSQVKITGLPENVAKAKAHYAEFKQGSAGVTIDVPRSAHHAISNNGRFFRDMRTQHNVTIDHGSHQIPPKSTAEAPASSSSAMPLITDDEPASVDAHNWSVSSLSSSDLSGTIPWILSGSPEAIALVQAKLQSQLQDATSRSHKGYLQLADPKVHRHIIGQGGSQIGAIRDQTGCKIDVPKTGATNQTILVEGSEQQVEQARELMLEAVRRGAERRGGGRGY